MELSTQNRCVHIYIYIYIYIYYCIYTDTHTHTLLVSGRGYGHPKVAHTSLKTIQPGKTMQKSRQNQQKHAKLKKTHWMTQGNNGKWSSAGQKPRSKHKWNFPHKTGVCVCACACACMFIIAQFGCYQRRHE